jgi:hypothetical protein
MQDSQIRNLFFNNSVVMGASHYDLITHDRTYVRMIALNDLVRNQDSQISNSSINGKVALGASHYDLMTNKSKVCEFGGFERSNGDCSAARRRCDRENDCADGSDEDKCVQTIKILRVQRGNLNAQVGYVYYLVGNEMDIMIVWIQMMRMKIFVGGHSSE